MERERGCGDIRWKPWRASDMLGRRDTTTGNTGICRTYRELASPDLFYQYFMDFIVDERKTTLEEL
jgi:hypothetical protein